jgi:hypothetical protein
VEINDSELEDERYGYVNVLPDFLELFEKFLD